ncbi:MAG: hypothetical protein JWN70_6852 [Planctomycetaceae bacterium]|nr:hypothetical protein [Planctomycetaceae bacterium]
MFDEQPEPEAFFIRLRGRVQGPFTPAQLQALHQRGQFSRTHEVSEDQVNWRSAATLSNVFVAPKTRPLPVKKTVSKPDSDDEIIDLEKDLTEKSPAAVVTGPAKMVKPVWHYSVGKETYGPVTILELRGLLAGGQLMGSDLVWKDGLPDWAPASEVAELSGASGPRASGNAAGGRGQTNYCSACDNAMDSRAEVCPQCGVRQLPAVHPKSRMVTAMLAIFLGSFGLHRFYLGQALQGLSYTFTWFLFTAAAFGFFMAHATVPMLFCILASGLPTLFSFVEGIVFLCTSDVSFARRYNHR